MILFADLETRSRVDIGAGSYRYAEDPSTQVVLFAYAIDDGPVQCWDATAGALCPLQLLQAVDRADTIVFHNGGQFDRLVLNGTSMGFDARRLHDTMVQALAHGLPGSLDELCDIFGLGEDVAKLKDGRSLVLKFCKPNKDGKWNDRTTHPAEWERYIEYAKRDVAAMRALYYKMPRHNYPDLEHGLWALDQRINDRGFLVDVDFAERCRDLIRDEKRLLADASVRMTNGEVSSATRRDALLKHLLEAHGVALPDLQKATLERRLEDPELPEEVKELLRVRLQATTVSTAKYATLLKTVCRDGRLRGTAQFCGASRTGRWAHRKFQPGNMARPTMDADALDHLIDAVKAGEDLELLCDNVMTATSDMLRGCIIAPPGKNIVAADLANIEGRVAAWLAGEQWKLGAFRAYDAGTGPDLYNVAYGRSFNVDPTKVMKDQRQVGKVQELALGFEGGVGAFLAFADVYRVDLDDMASKVLATAAPRLRKDAEGAWEWAVDKKQTYGLARATYVGCDVVKRAWRNAHPNIVKLWSALREGAIEAIEQPGALVRVGPVTIHRSAQWLYITLPSGRRLCYPQPRVANGKISYMGVNQYTRKWGRLYTYGGKLFENLCQAIARDVMAHNMPLIEAAGFDVVLTVHDEVVTEADEFSLDDSHLANLLAATPPWAEGLPLAAKGFTAKRYRKD